MNKFYTKTFRNEGSVKEMDAAMDEWLNSFVSVEKPVITYRWYNGEVKLTICAEKDE